MLVALSLTLPTTDVNHHMKGPGEVTAIAGILFELVDYVIPIFDTEDTIMDSAYNLIDFDGELDIPMENIEVSSDITPSDATAPPSCFVVPSKMHSFPVMTVSCP